MANGDEYPVRVDLLESAARDIAQPRAGDPVRRPASENFIDLAVPFIGDVRPRERDARSGSSRPEKCLGGERR